MIFKTVNIPEYKFWAPETILNDFSGPRYLILVSLLLMKYGKQITSTTFFKLRHELRNFEFKGRLIILQTFYRLTRGP